MAQLKDSVVSGNLRVTDSTLTNTLQTTIIKAPTSSGGTTYGPGTSGQVLKSNGTSVYWGADNNSITGSGTSGYLTKWNGTYSITNGPKLGSSTTTFLRNDGEWATPDGTTYSAGTGISLSGTTFSNAGVRSTTINGNYLRVNTNGTNADLTIPYATTASKLGSITVGSGSRPIYLYEGTPTQCNTPASGAYWAGVPYVGSNGVIEIGKYIDFHASNTTTNDYDYRITAETQTIYFTPKSSGDATYNLIRMQSPDYNQIQFQTSKTDKAYTSTGIVVYPLTTSGQTMLIQSDGNTVVGGGESPRTLYSNSYDSMDTAENETLYLAADSSEIHFVTNCQAYSGRKVLKVQDGQLVKSGGIWISARDNAPVYTNKPNTQDGGYYPAWFAKTKSGGWSMGVLSTQDNLYITYTTDTDYSGGSNVNTYQVQFQNKSGTVALTSDLAGYVPMETVTTDMSADTYFTKTGWVNWNKNAGTSTTNLPTANWGILLTRALPSVQVFIPDNASGLYFRRKADASTAATAWWGITGTAGNTYNLNNFISLSSISATNSGSGNAVTSISYSNGVITATKGNSFLPLSGGTMTGTITHPANTVAINLRDDGTSTWQNTIMTQSNGDEAVVFANANARTSWMFVNGEDSIAHPENNRWQSLTPALQIKGGCVAIGKLIPSGTTPTIKLDIAGSTALTGDIQLKTSGSSSDDSGDIIWYYGNGKEKMRIWSNNTYTAKSGPNFRVYKSDETLLFNGTLSLSDHTHTLSIAADSGTNALTLAANTKYKLTAGGSTFIFTTPASADKLTTARTISLGTDLQGSASFDGSGNITIGATNYQCSVNGGNKANYPWHRIAYVSGITGTYTDKDAVFAIRSGFNTGPFGIIKVSLRTNGSGAAVNIGARWIVRYGFEETDVVIASWGTSGQSVYADIFIKCDTWPRRKVYQMFGDRSWTLVSSNEVDNTTTSDKLTSTEVYATVASAGTEIHSQAYTSTVNANDAGIVNTAMMLRHKTLNSTTINNTAGSFAFSGSGDPWAGTDWVGLQIGDSVDKWQISGTGTSLVWRQNDSGGTNSADWSAWKNVLDSGNLSTYVKASSNNGKLSVNGSDVTVYTHPSKTAQSTSNFYKITVDSTGHVTTGDALTASNLPSHTHLYAGSASAGGPATKVNTSEGLSDGARPVFYAYLGDNQQVVYHSSFTYNPTGGVLTATRFAGNADKTGIRWKAISQGQKWSKFFYAESPNGITGSSGILSINCTRANVVIHATFLITAAHSATNFVECIQLSGGNYEECPIRVRVVAKNNPIVYFFEVYDTAKSIASGTTQEWFCCFIPIANTNITTYTTFTDGSTVDSGYTAMSDFTTSIGSAASAIKNITRSGTTFTATRQDGTTFTFTQQDSNTGDHKVSMTLGTTTKAYLLGSSTAPTSSAQNVTTIADTGVYLGTTAGTLYAGKFYTTSTASGYYLKDTGGSTYPGIFDNNTNLWIGAEQSTGYHHKGETYISTGWKGTLPTNTSQTLTGNSTIFISVPTYYYDSSASTPSWKWKHTPYWVLHSGNFTTTGSGNAITSVTFTNEQLTFTKGSTFSLSTHTHSQYYDSTISRTANTVLAAPNGSNGTATFRKLVAADIPDLSGTYLPLAGGTMTSGATITMLYGTGNIIYDAGTGLSVHAPTNIGWARGIDYYVGSTWYGGFGANGGSASFDSLYIGKYNDKAVSINPSNKTSTFYGIITAYRESATTDDLPAGIVFSNKDTTTGLTYSDAHIYAYNDHANPTYGENLVINASGSLFIGAGESADYHYAAIKSSIGTNEDIYMTADRYVYIQGCGNAIAARKGMVIYTTDSNHGNYHQILPTVADTATNNVGSIGSSSYKWYSIYASNYYGEFDCSNEVANNTQYAMVLAMNPNTQQPNTLRKTPNAIMTFKNGTASEEGWAQITLGNETKSGTAGNSTGWLKLFSSSSGYHYITGASTTSAITHTLPTVSGTVLNSGNYLQYTRSIQKLYAATSTKGWRRILTIPASNSSGYTIGRYEFHFTRQWNNGAPESFGVRVICNYTTPIIHLLYAEQNSRILTDFRVARSSDSTKIHFEVWYDATNKNDFSVRYVIQDAYPIPHDYCTFPTETDGSSAGSSFLPVVSDSPTSQATIPIPAGGISQFNLRQVTGSYSGYFGMADATGSDSAWIRTTSQGLLPYQSGDATSGGNCYLGTSGWYFANAYINRVYGNTADFECFQPRHTNEFSMKQISYNYIWFNYRLITDDKQGYTTEPTTPINQYWFGCGKARNALAKVVTSGMIIYPGAANATSYSNTLQSNSLTANRTASLPNATGTIPVVVEKYNSPTSTATSYNLTNAKTFKYLIITTTPSSSTFGEMTAIVKAPTAAGTTKTGVSYSDNGIESNPPTRILSGVLSVAYTDESTCSISVSAAKYYVQAGSVVASNSYSGSIYITKIVGVSY